MKAESTRLGAWRRGDRSERVGFGVFLFWSVVPLLCALLVLTWARRDSARSVRAGAGGSRGA